MRAGTAVAFAPPVVPRARWPVSAIALLALAVVLVWAHLAIAELTVCLNETPGLSADLSRTVPASTAIARTLLPLFGQNTSESAPVCDATAPARAMAIAGVAYLAAMVVLERGGISSGIQWVTVAAVAGTIQLALFFMPGLLSSDILDYASHGRVASIHAANPYLFAPAAFPSDPFSTQGAWPEVVTVYGPLWTRIDVAITGLLATATEVQLAFAYKLVGLVSHLVSIGLIWWIAGRWRALGVADVPRTVAVAGWAWNPLVNVELVGSAHNEGVMTVLVLLGFVLLTVSVSERVRQARQGLLWLAAVVCFGLGALVKFVPAAIGGVVSLVWFFRAASGMSALRRALVLAGVLLGLTLLVAWPWLDSPAIASPLLGLAEGGQRFKDAWQDAPAAWLTVRLVPLLGVPDDPATLRMDVARQMVWAVTRALFVAYVAVEAWFLWRHAHDPEATVLRAIACASVRGLLMAILLFVSQVYAWYFLWPLPMACLLGLREPWSRAAVVFGLMFLPAYYLREFQSYGVFYLPVYAELALAILALMWIWTRVPRRLRAQR